MKSPFSFVGNDEGHPICKLESMTAEHGVSHVCKEENSQKKRKKTNKPAFSPILQTKDEQLTRLKYKNTIFSSSPALLLKIY